MEKKSVEKSGNIVINAKAVKISNNETKKKKIRKTQVKFKRKKLNNAELQLALIENFANMQKVLTNLTIKFENLSGNISHLLRLFEESAKAFMEKHDAGGLNSEEEKKLLNKLDILLDQNRTVAKGITLIEEKMRHKLYGEQPRRENQLQPRITASEKPKPGLVPRV